MTITLRQESQTGTTTKNDTLTYAELDNNFIDLLTNKILPLQVNADTGVVTVGASQQNGVFAIQGGTGITTTVTEDSAGNATLTITKSVDEQGIIEIVGGSNIEATQPDSAGAVTLEVTNPAVLNVDGAVVFTAKNTSGGTIEKGQVVYISGHDGTNPTIGIADADDASKMPAFGLANEQITDTNTGEIITYGPITNIDTSHFNSGDSLYVNTGFDSVDDTITSTAPSGESGFIQKIGQVIRSHASTGSIFISGAGRTNATPNLNNGNVFIGNAQNQISTTSLATYITDRSINNVVEDTTPQLGGNLDVNGNSIISGSNNDINITPDGTGKVVLDGLKYPNADGTTGQFLKTDGAGNLAFADVTATGAIYHVNAGSGITVTQEDSAGEVTITNSGMINLSDDSAPELGGNLNLQNFKIVSTSAQDIKLEPDAGGDVYLESDTVYAGENNQQAHLTSQGTGNLLLSTNNETSSGTIKINQGASGNIEIQPDGGGRIRFHNAYNMPASDGSNGQVLTTDGFGTLSFTTIAGGGGVDIQAGTGITVTQDDSAGSYTISSTVTGGDSVGAGDNIQITNADSAGEKTISFNPNQPINFSDQQLSNLSIKNYGEIVYTGGTATGTITPDPNNGSVQSITLTGSITMNSLSSVASGDSMTLIVKQPASGGPYTLSSTMKFAGGTKTLSTTANAIDIITIFYDGTDYLASLSTNFS
jgi:hypothetical protein